MFGKKMKGQPTLFLIVVMVIIAAIIFVTLVYHSGWGIGKTVLSGFGDSFFG